MTNIPQYWLFWDGECGFCRRSVDWVQQRDARRLIHPVPYQHAPRPPMTDRLAEQCQRAIHVLTPDGTILSAGKASLCLLELIGYPRTARLAGLPPFIWFVECGYWLVARNRNFFSRLLFRSA